MKGPTVNFAGFDLIQMSTYDTFETMFGIELYTNEQINAQAVSDLKYLRGTVFRDPRSCSTILIDLVLTDI